MISVLPPFIVAAVVAVLYFALGGRGATPSGAAMKRDMNFYLLIIVITAVVSIIGGWRLGRDWLDYAAWVVAILAIVASVFRFKTASAAEAPRTEDQERGPLERASDRDR